MTFENNSLKQDITILQTDVTNKQNTIDSSTDLTMNNLTLEGDLTLDGVTFQTPDTYGMHVVSTQTGINNYVTNDKLPFNWIKTNKGFYVVPNSSDFNTSTYIYTIPVTGIWRFICQTEIDAVNTAFKIGLYYESDSNFLAWGEENSARFETTKQFDQGDQISVRIYTGDVDLKLPNESTYLFGEFLTRTLGSKINYSGTSNIDISNSVVALSDNVTISGAMTADSYEMTGTQGITNNSLIKKEYFTSTISPLQTSVSTLEGDMTTAQGNISTLQSDMTTAQGDITTLQSDVLTKQNELTATDDIKIRSLVLGSTNNPIPVNDGEIYAYNGNFTTSLTTTSLTCGTINASNNADIDFKINNNSKMILDSNGRLGIGNTNPKCPLHVSGSVDKNVRNSDPGYYEIGSQASGNVLSFTSGQNSKPIGLYVEDGYSVLSRAYIGRNMYFSSDSRIKKDIVDIVDDEALTQIRQIKPKTYLYKDPVERTDKRVIGFIAQDIKNDLPLAHDTRNEIIPNIMKLASVTNNILTFTENIELENDENGDFYKVLIVYDSDENKVTLNIAEIIDSMNIRVENTDNVVFNDNNNLFVYGQEVDNFNCIDKSYIYTVNVAATQELDRQLQAEKNKNATLEAQLADVLSRLEQLEHTVSVLDSNMSN